jgi:ABC-type metal ion transport system substrate-binding protein
MVDVRDIIHSIQAELDKEYATYQFQHRKYHKDDDEVAKMVHYYQTSLCRRILKEISKGSE